MAAINGDKIFVGLDFGTTFSGVGFAYGNDPDVIDIVMDWKSEFRRCSDVEKTPSKISYDSKSKTSSWGYGVPAATDSVSWFKLLLLKDTDVPVDIAASLQFSEAKKAQRKLGKDAVEIVTDYLSKLWEHTVKYMKRSLGDDLVERCDLHVNITVPAIWPPYAHQDVRKAAGDAGVLTSESGREVTLGLISEPEAAALATVHDMGKRTNMKIGDTIVLCDAGGGTVDLISYIVDGLSSFSVSECVMGGGGLCGGIFLDEEFLNTVKQKCGNPSWPGFKDGRRAAFLNDDWEHGIKKQFENEERDFLVDMPADFSPRGGKRCRSITLSRSDIFPVFDTIICKVEALVEAQLAAIRTLRREEATYIAMAGGFGRNRYLYERLKKIAHPSTTILQAQGTRPWTAICRGAVIHGLVSQNFQNSLSVKVQARIARMNYGSLFLAPWVEGGCLPEDKLWHKRYLAWYAENQMDWHLKLGDNMETSKPVRKTYIRLLRAKDTTSSASLYVSDAVLASSRKDQSVKMLCTVRWQLSTLKKSIPLWTNAEGTVFRKLTYEIEMTCHGGSIEFAVFYGDQKIASQHVDVSYH